jgi:Zn ribbon nucleic-acid-binding protein
VGLLALTMKPSKYLCPQCNLNEAVAILYGYPSPETLKAWHNKEVELGGCIVGGEIPNRKCIKCNFQWNEA